MFVALHYFNHFMYERVEDYRHSYCKKCSLIFDFTLIAEISLKNKRLWEKYFLFKVVRDSCAYSLLIVPHSLISFYLSFTLESS